MTVLLSPYCDDKLKLCGNISLSIEKNKINNNGNHFPLFKLQINGSEKGFQREYLIITKKQITNST